MRSRLSGADSLDEKLGVINSDPRVNRFFNHSQSEISRALESLRLEDYELYLLKCVVAAGQEHVLGSYSGSANHGFEPRGGALRSALYALVEMIEKWDGSGDQRFGSNGHGRIIGEKIDAVRMLLKTLREMEQFYDCIGGIIGYQITVLELLAESRHGRWRMDSSQFINEIKGCQFMEIHPPNVLDLSKNTEYASKAALWGIEGLPDLGEIYPLGGSADRLGLVDPNTGECLPAAMLPFCGRTLLEGLIRDLQAREFLYLKLYGKQCITPVAIMTSAAKNNHEHITSLCEKHEWFGRGQLSFQIFEQPLVPVVNAEDGEWLVSKQFVPLCKPGGHGVIWKLAYDKGIFQWFANHRRKGATVRQVSNVVAATDVTLLALAGIGLHSGKKLGFASCKRSLGATEGINVLVERKKLDGNWVYGISCVEYTEFEKYGITDGPPHESLQVEFPANTNILYVDLTSAAHIGSSKSEACLPGMVLNTKKSITFMDSFGMQQCVSGGRLECTMQNIADNFFTEYSSRCNENMEDLMDTFVVYNERRKVTSSAKKKRKNAGKSLHQTPDGALLDILRNAHELLSHCDISMPNIETNDRYIVCGPPFLIFLHPALGPLWDVSRQKFCGGSISEGSELQIEVAEFLWRDVQLKGSLIVIAENIMGSTRTNGSGEPILEYGYRCGKCRLENIKVVNAGIDWKAEDNIYWKHDVQRHEALKVILHGNAEFEAVDVVLEGNQVFEVPDGHKLKITSGISGLISQLNPIEETLMDTGTWYWKYKIKDSSIELEKVDL